ncbi:MAG: HD domain-containing protein [Patescibacteria group bacterium]
MLSKYLSIFDDLLNTGALERIQATWEEGGLLDPAWENVCAHMSAVAAIGMAIANLTGLEKPYRVVCAALIHDAGKRREIEAVKAVKVQNGDVAAEYDRQAKAQEDFLHNMGWPNDFIAASQSVGHTSLQAFLEWEHLSDLCQIIHLADDLTAGSDFPDLAERMANNRKRYPEIDQQGKSRYQLKGNTFDVQEQIARELLGYFAQVARLSEESFYQKIVEKAKARLAS